MTIKEKNRYKPTKIKRTCEVTKADKRFQQVFGSEKEVRGAVTILVVQRKLQPVSARKNADGRSSRYRDTAGSR